MRGQVTSLRKRLIGERLAIEARISAHDRDVLDAVPADDGAGDDQDDVILSDDLDVQRLRQVKKALARLETEGS
ncbi:MAG TPA: hypothetical protein VFL27_14155 [Candidatus Dormibacteraeota bacterium]|nr:hypothetical protein [Candidatus Dormibacteraeota bacterium]